MVIATPAGPATGLTSRHFRNLIAVMHPIIRYRYDMFGCCTIAIQIG
ncbi:hypothetical protein MHOL44478_19355 [Mycobacterium holsaticum DSM 44478]|nr:hypothetical protein [Mycolicibacterium holsaticum DSM 44478 = JCM 12374]